MLKWNIFNRKNSRVEELELKFLQTPDYIELNKREEDLYRFLSKGLTHETQIKALSMYRDTLGEIIILSGYFFYRSGYRDGLMLLPGLFKRK